MFFSVDRVVAGKAMLIGEDRKPLEVPMQMLPAGAKNGDMLRYQDGAFFPAPEKTAQRRARVAEMLGMLLREDAQAEQAADDEERGQRGQPGAAEKTQGEESGEDAENGKVGGQAKEE